MKSLSSSLKSDPVQRYLLLGLIAIELLMSFSFLGYLHVQPISITFAFIPVLLAGCLINPGASALLGLIFGLASMWKASAPYVAAGDRIFSPLLSEEPFSSLLLSIGSRVLFGLLIGLLFLEAKRAKKYSFIWISIVAFAGRGIHSLCVYSFMGLLFPEMGFNALSTLDSLGSPSNLLTAFIAFAIVLLAWFGKNSAFYKKFSQKVCLSQRMHLLGTDSKYLLYIVVIIALTILSACAIAFYFIQRMLHVLDTSGYHLDDTANYNITHLQIQFLLGLLSLLMLVILLLMIIYRHITYISYEAKTDQLTGILNRNGFFRLCENILSDFSSQNEPAGYFLILDIDHFKIINDSFGHPAGDKILHDTAQLMKEFFYNDGIIGRLGGDEFTALIYGPSTVSNIESTLDQFMERFRQLPCNGSAITCSMGVVPVTKGCSTDSIYKCADHYLYLAKSSGRNCYRLDNSEKNRL